ncbi:hypothetical protein PR048_013391 [Dryococelus australis]|uniref:Uncharacterized protein n=1 Tax=Dryococelus australis TaxID=614101 RepID=A0ABQ9HS14_9NEOP|nr:hypothetical protein PR048_013391 [Dryococelus australis]
MRCCVVCGEYIHEETQRVMVPMVDLEVIYSVDLEVIYSVNLVMCSVDLVICSVDLETFSSSPELTGFVKEKMNCSSFSSSPKMTDKMSSASEDIAFDS